VYVGDNAAMMHKFNLSFTLSAHSTSPKEIKNAFSEFAQEILIQDQVQGSGSSVEYKVSLVSEEPEAIFDICGQLGRIRSVKVDEIDK
jgi:hypothetical protein